METLLKHLLTKVFLVKKTLLVGMSGYILNGFGVDVGVDMRCMFVD